MLPGPGGFGAAGRGWTPIVAARLGWSIRDAAPAVGVQLRIPLPIPVLRPSLTAGGDLVFQQGLRERQGFADATLGMFAPLYVGGGAVALNSVFSDSAERQTKLGFSLVANVRGGRMGPLTSEIEFRWMKVGELSPRFLTLSLGYQLRGD